MDALALAEAVRAGEVGARELVERSLAAIEHRDPELNAFVTVCADEALAAADGPLPAGPFTGVPIAIKDLTETAGIRTTFSSRAFADYVPLHDTAAVRRLRDAGFVIVGKTNTPEFGVTCVTESELNGNCRNPWDTSRTPGGSSGGAAAAVAAGMVPVAHGSDGGGSIRIPAACCGLVGLKPARGRISAAPYGDGLAGLATDGALTVSVRDTAALLDVLSGYEPGDPSWAAPPARPFADEVGADPGRLRIALAPTPPVPVAVDEPCLAAARSAAELLTDLGHEVVEATPPWQGDDLLGLFTVPWAVGPKLYPVSDPALLTPLNRALARIAETTPSHEYVLAIGRLQALARRVVAWSLDYDAVLTPALAKLPVPVGWVLEPDEPMEQFQRGAEFTPFTPLVNVTGQPAIAVPFDVADGLPVAIQLIGRPADEATLLRLASQLELARPWVGRLPHRFGEL